MRPLGRSPGELSDALYSGMFPMLPFANCIRDNRLTFEGRRHEVTANMAGTRLNFHGSGWQSPWLRGRYGSMFRHDRGQLVAMPFGSYTTCASISGIDLPSARTMARKTATVDRTFEAAEPVSARRK